MHLISLVLMLIGILDTDCQGDADRHGHLQADIHSNCYPDANKDRSCHPDGYCHEGRTYDSDFGLGADRNQRQCGFLFPICEEWCEINPMPSL
jgi:hypothetical protein